MGSGIKGNVRCKVPHHKKAGFKGADKFRLVGGWNDKDDSRRRKKKLWTPSGKGKRK